VTLAAAGFGFVRGVTPGTVALLGFGVGALLGSRLAPLVLEEGVHSAFAPAVALPGALLLGGLFGAGIEHVAFRRGRWHRLGRLDPLCGAILGACLAVIAVWLLASIAAQVHSLRSSVQRSAILEPLNAALPPPGPVLVAPAARLGSFPTFKGPAPPIPPPDPTVVRHPSIEVAARSVVKVEVEGCGAEGSGSGWFAARRLVVTNAHVVAGVDSIAVQVHGQRSAHPATAVWYDAKHDVALLRVSGTGRVAPLPIAPMPTFGTSGAMLGFPAGYWDARAARVGETGPLGNLERVDRPRDPIVSRRSVTAFAGKGQPGYSGGPIVNTSGQVLTTIFGGFQVEQAGFGVPNEFVRTALTHVGPPVRHGSCEQA
jgi:S1-C subfamily serine protease